VQQVLLGAVASERRIERRFGVEVIGSDRRGGIEVRMDDGVHHLRGVS